MPVQKFRSTDEAREALWPAEGDVAAATRSLRKVLRMAARLAPAPTLRGIRKFRDIESANRERSAREAGQRSGGS